MKRSVSLLPFLAIIITVGNLNAKPVLSSGETLGYAYLKDGKSLIKTSISREYFGDDVETIIITENGFYPDYQVPNDSRNCGKHFRNGQYEDLSKNNFCQSNFTKREASSIVGNTLMNSLLVPIGALGQQKAVYMDSKTFDEKKFLQVVEQNGLEKIRNEYLEVQQIKKQLSDYTNLKKNELDKIYLKALEDYKENVKLISINYSLKDLSGLYPNKERSGDYYIDYNIPEQKSFDFNEIIQSFDPANSKEEALIKLEQLKNKVDEKSKNDEIIYKKYVALAFKSYKVRGTDNFTIRQNDNISFNVKSKAPQNEISYLPGKKITINIPITIEYADVKGMVPKEYILQDANFNMLMKTDNGLNIKGVMSNKTQSFLTVKSLTSYYQNLVFNVSNLDKELAPEARDLDDGTRYPLITYAMSEKSNFEKMTKNKAQAIKMNYGYAVKYKMNDTNIEKAIYNTKNYSLYDIIQQYL